MSSKSTTQFQQIGLFLLSVVGIVGCGGGTAEEFSRAAVQGKVTLDGADLKQGVIRFVPKKGTSGPKVSVLIENGEFSATAENGPVIGGHRIEIESTDNGGYALDDERAIEQLKASGKRTIEVITVPAAYNTNSTLQAAVTVDGPNEYEFPLSSKPTRAR
jgi:hypothetical protein